MFRDPWFRIIEVVEPQGLSLADIVKQVAQRHRTTVERVRSGDRSHKLAAARREIYQRAKRERPDLTSAQIAIFMGKESSVVRHVWRQMEAA